MIRPEGNGPPEKHGTGALLLTPGAGGDRDHRTFVAIEDELHSRGTVVHRIDFDYRSGGMRPPPAPPALIENIEREAKVLAERAGCSPSDLVLGGRSLGGRMCSMAVAEGHPTRGLVLLSYPLHPERKPEKLRVEHFGAIDVPVLFVGGTRDPFGTPEEFARHVDAIAGPVTMHWLDGARHDPKGFDDEIAPVVASWMDALA